MTYGTQPQNEIRSKPLPCTQWSEVTSFWRSQPWVADASRTISRISTLQDDWDGQGSPAPSRAALESMNRVIREIDAYDLPSPHISPVSGGGLGIEWHQGQRDLSIELLQDGSIEYLRSQTTSGEPDIDQMEDGVIPSDRVNEVRNLVRWLLNW